MLTDAAPLLGTTATGYSLVAGGALLLQIRTMLRRGSSDDVSLSYLAAMVGGYALWLLYGLGIGSMPLIVSDAVGLVCSIGAVAVAVSLRGSVLRLASPAECE